MHELIRPAIEKYLNDHGAAPICKTHLDPLTAAVVAAIPPHDPPTLPTIVRLNDLIERLTAIQKAQAADIVNNPIVLLEIGTKDRTTHRTLGDVLASNSGSVILKSAEYE